MPNKLASTEMFDEMAKWVLARVRRTALVHVSWRMPVHSLPADPWPQHRPVWGMLGERGKPRPRRLVRDELAIVTAAGIFNTSLIILVEGNVRDLPLIIKSDETLFRKKKIKPELLAIKTSWHSCGALKTNSSTL
ncbi:uncharacterized protein PADG_00797 [Paracoccidioides brasiliensis Pb18]|uniref:Uncharacterized protein n=1 Tax=Paracoccidioides brasiliensis (strain Pb18) TaxID=502780 RepID=C1FYC1_PARBD|nr:uncharacterized protein PADG_00797 [Paracoccidioides brasiliensis Pb18]EEH44508.2 hypothetical protein PADG_00797 [Paracoccidioides brasiliensis Pb18]